MINSVTFQFPKGRVEFTAGSNVKYNGLVPSWQGQCYKYTYVVSLYNGDSYEEPTNEFPSRACALRKLNIMFKRSLEAREYFV